MKIKCLMISCLAIFFLALGINVDSAPGGDGGSTAWVSKPGPGSIKDMDDNTFVSSSPFDTEVSGSYLVKGLPSEGSADLYAVDTIIKTLPGRVRDKEFVAKITNGEIVKLEAGKFYFLKNTPATEEEYAVCFNHTNDNYIERD